ncbi:hypothetical protein [Corallococcus exiguus]|nr:hypothetical protein [Corallococcus exiguus]
MTFFNRNVSRMLCSVALLTLANCGPLAEDASSLPEQEVATARQAVSNIA